MSSEPRFPPLPLAIFRKVFSGGGWLLLLAASLLASAAMCANFRQVFPAPGQVCFVDADCYARMTRVRAVVEQPGLVLKHHDFENSPFGTRPHTTVPLDYAIAGLQLLLRPFSGERALDWAGAWISPLLGLMTIGSVWFWAKESRLSGGPCTLLLLAASPILAHGFELGRPDHQSLVLLCMALALAAEWRLWRAPTRAWGLVSGLGWAVGLWTSLYEPLILLFLELTAALLWNRSALRERARLPGLVVGIGLLFFALLIEGWRIDAAPGFGVGAGAEYFAAWTRQIGELISVPPWSGTLYAWSGLALMVAPVLLLWKREEDRGLARANLLLLGAVFLLTCWQVRWGYFLPLVYALSLPWQFDALPARWRPALGIALILGLAPMAHEWADRANPSPKTRENLAEQRTEASLLRAAAAFIARETTQHPATDDPPAAGILAPWWLSPPLAYWSGQPAVAGSSHEALPGTVDAARFFMATDARQAGAILRRRRVRWVVAYEPSRVQSTSSSLLGLDPPPARFLDLALFQRPEFAPRYLRLVFVNPYFKIYEVQVDSLPYD